MGESVYLNQDANILSLLERVSKLRPQSLLSYGILTGTWDKNYHLHSPDKETVSERESDLFKVTALGRVDPGSDLGPGGYLGHHVGWELDSPVSLDPDPQGPIASTHLLGCSFVHSEVFVESLLCTRLCISAGDTAENKTDKNPTLVELTYRELSTNKEP